MKKTYQCLDFQEYKKNEFSLVPIRLEDRYKIMQWRNEQMYHLRQSKTLTRQEQDRYFNTVVLSLFDQEKPDQVLFSFLKKKIVLDMEVWYILTGEKKQLKYHLSLTQLWRMKVLLIFGLYTSN